MALRARWKDEPCPVTGLQKGQCFLGDYAACGLTDRKYRTAKDVLKTCGFATFTVPNKKRKSGTVGTLLPQGIFSLEKEGEPDGETDKKTDERRITDGYATSNLQGYKDTKEECTSCRTNEPAPPDSVLAHFPEPTATAPPAPAEKPKSGRQQQIDELAAAIWGDYPQRGKNRSSRKELRRELEKVKTLPTVAAVVDALTAWKKSTDWTEKEGRFVPAVNRFAKEERWNDPPTPPPTAISSGGYKKTFGPRS